jgi:release factor glutamine methyltransferase
MNIFPPALAAPPLATAAACPAPGSDTPFRPSEYTGLLLQAVQDLLAVRCAGSVLEMGVGSGVVLAAMGKLGARRLRGVDIDPDAVAATNRLLRGLSLADRARISRGYLWDAVGRERFEIIAANLPQFPTTAVSDPDRGRFWGAGGADGRAVMDPFLEGLAAHMESTGVALITHSTIVDVAATSAVLARHGLVAERKLAAQVRLAPDKAALLDPALWERFAGRGLLLLGACAFIEAQVLEIRWA